MITLATGKLADQHFYLKEPGWRVLDVTRQSGEEIYAPSWSLIHQYKDKKISWPVYVATYRDMMEASRETHLAKWNNLISRNDERTLVLLCVCDSDQHCHRRLLADILRRHAGTLNVDCALIGEM